MTRPRLLGVLAVVSLCALAGCSSGGAGEPTRPEVPDDAVALIENQPNQVAGVRVVASLIDDEGADLSGSDGTAPATGGWADVGQSVEISGVTFRLVATWVDPEPGDAPGADRSTAWVVVE